MNIAISATGRDLMSDVDPRFGRAAFFVIIDTKSEVIRAIENVQHLNLSQGAGIQAARTVAAERVDALITGNCGPKAFRVLQAAGIEVITGARGRVENVIQNYLSGGFKTAEAANVEGHWM